MKTSWGDSLKAESVLQEYPRPQLARSSYINLNGYWEYSFKKIDEFEQNNTLPLISTDGQILVPFSPESGLSGVCRALMRDELLIYQRKLNIPSGFNIGRILLHLDAVDSICAVYINGALVSSHIGGYTPVIADITDALRYDGEDILNVVVTDRQEDDFLARGKQRTKRGVIWYTAQSGIWQTAWLESVPVDYIESLKITPDIDAGNVTVTVNTNDAPASSDCVITLDEKNYSATANKPCVIHIENAELWSPENPHLYYFTATYGRDSVNSYFAMRKFSTGTDSRGIPRLMLNNRPYFHNGLLDQGYWSDGIMTPPCDEAMVYDIALMKSMGFNMLRKHIKIEPLRWYYHCDRLGMLVWQDFVSGGMNVHTPDYLGRFHGDGNYKAFGRATEESRERYYIELEETVRYLYNVPSIAMWVPFNEGWGQFDALIATQKVRELDTTRTIDHASGWHDQGGSDVKSVHVYVRPYIFKKDKHGRAVVLSEFGGYNLRVDGHFFSEKEFGYIPFKTCEHLKTALEKLYTEQIIPARKKGLCAAVYTQVSDVEDELNGFVTYDRQIVKVDPQFMLELNGNLSGIIE